MTKKSIETLNKEQTKAFELFLRKKKITNVRVGKIIGCSGANVGYLLKKYSFLKEDFKKVRKELKDEALIGFDEIEF